MIKLIYRFIVVVIITMLMLTSCYTTTNVISKQTFDNAIKETENSINKMGFYKNSESTATNSNVTSTSGIIYMPNVGYIPYHDEKKDETIIDNYSYTDTLGNTVKYSIAYKLKESSDNILYIENPNIVSRITSNPNQYIIFFGTDSPIERLNYIPKSDSVSLFNEEGTLIGILFGTIIGCVFMLLLLL